MGDWLKNKVAIVTGSGQGIGRAIALAMAKEGAMVVTSNRQPRSSGGDAQTTADEITSMEGQALPFFGDISSFDVAKKLVQTAVEHFGRLDILVNNAIVYVSRPIWEMTEEDWDNCLDTGLKGAFNCTRHACVVMKEQKWGRILNATSRTRLGGFEFSNYGAAKAGIEGFSRSVARDVGRFGITCNAFSPSAATRWTTAEARLARHKRSYEAGIITRQQYEKRLNTPPPPPETIPPLLVYLSTDLAADINGQVFRIEGDRIANHSEPEEKNAIYKKEALWTVEELRDLIPGVVLNGYTNPAPPQPNS
ncbi:SDR family NAD(P)-dependent oxidoreductase [Chloroflexota bacterium]